jgi:F0F1-type ATP synthase delta subunit
VGQELQAFTEVYRSSAELQDVLKNPTVELDEKQSVLGAVLTQINTRTMARNFLLVLLDSGRITVVGELSHEHQRCRDQQHHQAAGHRLR